MTKGCANDEVPVWAGVTTACELMRTSSEQNTKTNQKRGKIKSKDLKISLGHRWGGQVAGRMSYRRQGSRWPANLLLAAPFREQFDA